MLKKCPIISVSLLISILVHTVFIAAVSGYEIPLLGFISSGRLVANFIEEERPTAGALKAHSSRSLLFRDLRKGGGEAESGAKPDISERDLPDAQQSGGVSVQKDYMQPESGAASGSNETGAVEAAVPAEARQMQAESPKPQVTAEVPKQGPAILSSVKEKFYFDIYWLGMFVGKAVLEAVNENGTVTISSSVHSAPLISAFYKVEDFAESRVVNGLPARFRIKQREGKYRSDKETIFDQDGGKVTFLNYLNGTRGDHDAGGKVLWDVISGFYYMRTKALEVGKPVSISVFDSNKFLNAEVNVLKREKVSVGDMKEVDAFIVQPVLKSEGLFQSKGEIFIWLTDDEAKTPVKVETKVPIGTVVARLTKMERQ